MDGVSAMRSPFWFKTRCGTAPLREPFFSLGDRMQLKTREGTSKTDLIAFQLLIIAVITAILAFGLGRNDPTVKTAVLLCVTNLVTALTSIGATLLVGKPTTTHQVEANEGTRLTTQESQTTSVQPVDCDKEEEKTR